MEVLALVVVLLQPPALGWGPTQAGLSWRAVLALPSGRAIEVVTGTQVIRGSLVASSPSEVRVRERNGGAVQVVLRDAVVELRTLDQPAAKGPAILLGLAGGVALAIMMVPTISRTTPVRLSSESA